MTTAPRVLDIHWLTVSGIPVAMATPQATTLLPPATASDTATASATNPATQGIPRFPFNTGGTTVSGGPRIGLVVGFAAITAAVIAWALRGHARFLPTGAFVPRHALATAGHHQSDYLPPAPVTGEAIINYPGLIMLALHLTAAAILAAAWLTRRLFRDTNQVEARLSFAVLGSVVGAVVTVPVAAVTLGNAILFTGTLAAAMTVLQYTFVLVVAGTALFGVP